MKDFLLFWAAFLACSVEMVEAMTVVLAVAVTKNWRTALTGVAAGFLALFVVVAALGPALVNVVPLSALQVVVGGLLLVFGMQWLRKAILRASGLKAQHDEDAIFQANVAQLDAVPETAAVTAGNALDWTGFVVSFKGVFLEGLEVAFIVLTFGANSGSFVLSGAGALASFVIIVGIGLAIHKPLSRVPENWIKFVVGIMLTAFGTFWGGEGIGVEWKLGDATILVAIALYSLVAFTLVELLKRRAALQLSVNPGAAH